MKNKLASNSPATARTKSRAFHETLGSHTFQSYIANATAESTRKAYAADLRDFRAWGGRIPATPAMVARYISAFAGKVKASTLSRRLAAIASAHTALGRPSPTRADLVKTTLRGIRRMHGTAQSQAKPISIEMLRQLSKPQRHLDPVCDLRDRALLVVGFAGGFRRSELVRLRLDSLAFGNDGVTVTLMRSKTDQQGRGRVVALPHGPGPMCPVKLLRSWLKLLGELRSEDGGASPLFRRVDRYGQPGDGLSGAAVGALIRRRMTMCNLDPCGFSAHSLRSGLVTAAVKAGVSTWAIQQQTGHRSERTVHRYIRGVSPFARNPFRSIART